MNTENKSKVKELIHKRITERANVDFLHSEKSNQDFAEELTKELYELKDKQNSDNNTSNTVNNE